MLAPPPWYATMGGLPVSEQHISVPTELRRSHRFVIATRAAAKGVKPDDSGRLDIGRRPGVIHLRVSRELLRRALLIVEALVAEALRRGYSVEAIEKSYNHRAGCALAVRGHKYPFEISEMTDRRPLTEREVARWRSDNRYRLSWQPDLEPPLAHTPNGRLRLSLPDYHVKRANWTEGPRGRLEAKLLSVFTELERRAEEDDRRDAERRLREEARRREDELRRERERLQEIEARRLERLREEIATWRFAVQARAYVAELRARVDESPADHEGIAVWCDWIDEWAERANPTSNLSGLQGLDEMGTPTS